MNQLRCLVIVVSYNSADYVNLTLSSLAKASNRTAMDVFLVDNGSRPPEVARIREHVARLVAEGASIVFEPLEKNLGFSGGNNVGLRHFLQDSRYSHACLLNSDTVVADGWLDRLLACKQDAVGPVSNAVGNDQTVAVNYEILVDQPLERIVSNVRAYAESRFEALADYTHETEFLGFFCVLLSRKLVDGVGLLDEQFFPGAFEDDDYCERIKAAGFPMYIARGIFVHHFGSRSFGSLPRVSLLRDLDVNKRKFEAKHQILWVSRDHLPFRGAFMDLELLRNSQGAQASALFKVTSAALESFVLNSLNRDVLVNTAPTNSFFGRARRILKALLLGPQERRTYYLRRLGERLTAKGA